MKYHGDHDDDDRNVALGYNWVTIELALREISWICPTIYPDIQTTTIYPDTHNLREVFKKPSKGNIPIRGYRTSAGQKVSRNFLAKKGGTPPT